MEIKFLKFKKKQSSQIKNIYLTTVLVVPIQADFVDQSLNLAQSVLGIFAKELVRSFGVQHEHGLGPPWLGGIQQMHGKIMPFRKGDKLAKK